MMGRGGRERPRKDSSSSWKSEEKGTQSRNNAPPSRHLWVGNLSHHISESGLSEQFLRFGEIESIAFPAGRSYAFVNFKKEEDALIAVKGLQGFVVAGLPLKIEFAKAERPVASSRDDEYLKRGGDRLSADRETSLFQRDARGRPPSVDPSYPDNSRMEDKDAEPNEVLWVGFPASLNVDEAMLRMAFSPFGEIEKITAFPGRTYAFVQFRSLMAACRAKETLHRKLFDNPRVHICFARKENSTTEDGRRAMNNPFPHHFSLSGHPFSGYPGHPPANYWPDRYFGNPTEEPRFGTPHFMPDLDSGDSSFNGFSRNYPVRTGGGDFEHFRLPGPGAQFGSSESTYKRYRSSPARERSSHPNGFSPERFPRNFAPYEDHSDLQADAFPFHEAKKIKMGSFPSDKEPPANPFGASTQEKPFTGLPKPFNDFPERETYDKNFSSGPFSYNRVSDTQTSTTLPHGERDDHWKPSHERSEGGSGSLPINPVQSQILSPESHPPPASEVWKWEGTIAKGGTPVCRARCFPVGKAMDFKLPEFLDCTARTGLDMLSKHFYQAASSWVVFFVPESDADITFYNEFLHYLGEKQRAAVAKLGEKTTLFLVPPSDFSETVLKVPGKMSISGVILKFQNPSSEFGSPHHPLESMDSNLPSFQPDVSYSVTETPSLRSSGQGQSQSYTNSSSESFPSLNPLPVARIPGKNDHPVPVNFSGPASSAPVSASDPLTGRMPESLNENRYYQPPQPRNPPPSWPPHQAWNPTPGAGILPPPVSSGSAGSLPPQLAQDTSSSQNKPGVLDLPSSGPGKYPPQETKLGMSSAPPVPSLQPEQLAHLASLLGQRQQQQQQQHQQQQQQQQHQQHQQQHQQQQLQQKQQQQQQSVQENRNPANQMNHMEHAIGSSQKSTPQNQSSSSNPSTSQFSQVHQMLQTSIAPQVPQKSPSELLRGALERQGNQPLLNSGGQQQTDTDPQKRLQATLQLAATLLQQIQQQSKGSDQRKVPQSLRCF